MQKIWEIDKTWCLFLDRDGVINQRKIGGYIQKVEEFKFLERVPETIAQLSKKFKYIFVVTNQQGIGKKLMTEEELAILHQHMIAEIEARGGKITRCYHAPNIHSENSSLRKPNVGMAIKAKNEFPKINFSKSIMVGDSDSDIIFGHKLKMKTVRILSDEKPKIDADVNIVALHQLTNLV